MVSIHRSAALAAGLLLACFALGGCTASTEDGYSDYRPGRRRLNDQVQQDVRAMLEGMLRAHYGQYGSWER